LNTRQEKGGEEGALEARSARVFNRNCEDRSSSLAFGDSNSAMSLLSIDTSASEISRSRNKSRKGGGGGFEVGVAEVSPKSESGQKQQFMPPRSSPYKDLKLPSYTTVSSSPTVAAGVPVLELVRKFEEEKILNRDDRVALNEALYSIERRDGITKALRDVELSANSRFAIKRLKALIHQNGTGEMTSSQYVERKRQAQEELEKQQQQMLLRDQQQEKDKEQEQEQELSLQPQVDEIAGEQQSLVKKPHLAIDTTSKSSNGGNKLAPVTTTSASSPKTAVSPTLSKSGTTGEKKKRSQKTAASGAAAALAGEEDEDDRSCVSISQWGEVSQSAILKVVGDTPLYSQPDNFNVCIKIARRLKEFLLKYKPSTMGVRKFAVLVGGGSFNPLTRMHLRSYFVAKQYLEAKAGFIVLGSLLSPAHGITVRERYRTNSSEIIPSPHRLAVAQLLVQDSKWLSIDPWEMTRRRPMDYLSLLQHAREILNEHFPDIDIKLLYLCKPNAVPKVSPLALRAENAGIVTVCRATDFDQLRASLSAKWNGLIWVIEDTAVLDASMDVVTSRKVREKIRAGEPIQHLVGNAISDYFIGQKIGQKMNGVELWTEQEMKLPTLSSRPAEPYHGSSLLSTINSITSHLGDSLLSPSQHSVYTPSWGFPNAPIFAKRLVVAAPTEGTLPPAAELAQEKTENLV